MPNPNAIVGLIARIDPPVVGAGTEMFRAYPDGFSIQLEGDRAVRLSPGDNAAAILEILDSRRQRGAPVYIEIDPRDRRIARLLLPLTVLVTNVRSGPGEEFAIELEPSHARHSLRQENPYFQEIITTLRDLHAKRAWAYVTEGDDHEIIDVRPAPAPREPPLARERPAFLKRLWFCLIWLLRCMSPRKAAATFNLVAAQSCNPLTAPAPCIPFLYPDDGCWARAHEMCRLMLGAGVYPRKVWIYGNLHTLTKNNPACFVNWGWHVAPTLCVRKWIIFSQERVIDPALFSGPVSKQTWKSVQGDPNAQLYSTHHNVYHRHYQPWHSDPNYVLTNQHLADYRDALKLRSINQGPPPYNCP